MIYSPPGKCSSPSRDDETLRKQREEIRKKLLKGEPVFVDPQGAALAERPTNTSAIQVPPGKLASFYWYEGDQELFEAEKEAMRKFFPQFSLTKAPDGRLAWLGNVTPGMLKEGRRTYTLQVVYEHDHPNNNSFGGSVKIYSIDPDLENLATTGLIPHTLRDSASQIYICTSRQEDFQAGLGSGQAVTSAASAIGWAVKWITCFELWLNGDLSDAQFRSHI